MYNIKHTIKIEQYVHIHKERLLVLPELKNKTTVYPDQGKILGSNGNLIKKIERMHCNRKRVL